MTRPTFEVGRCPSRALGKALLKGCNLQLADEGLPGAGQGINVVIWDQQEKAYLGEEGEWTNSADGIRARIVDTPLSEAAAVDASNEVLVYVHKGQREDTVQVYLPSRLCDKIGKRDRLAVALGDGESILKNVAGMIPYGGRFGVNATWSEHIGWSRKPVTHVPVPEETGEDSQHGTDGTSHAEKEQIDNQGAVNELGAGSPPSKPSKSGKPSKHQIRMARLGWTVIGVMSTIVLGIIGLVINSCDGNQNQEPTPTIVEDNSESQDCHLDLTTELPKADAGVALSYEEWRAHLDRCDVDIGEVKIDIKRQMIKQGEESGSGWALFDQGQSFDPNVEGAVLPRDVKRLDLAVELYHKAHEHGYEPARESLDIACEQLRQKPNRNRRDLRQYSSYCEGK